MITIVVVHGGKYHDWCLSEIFSHKVCYYYALLPSLLEKYSYRYVTVGLINK